MHIPEKRVCDLCRSELIGPYVVMSYPLDQADRDMLLVPLKADMPEQFRILGGLIRCDAEKLALRFLPRLCRRVHADARGSQNPGGHPLARGAREEHRGADRGKRLRRSR